MGESNRIIKQLQKLTEISIALSSHEVSDALVQKILLGAKSLTNADGGTLYKVADDRVTAEVMHTDSLGLYRVSGQERLPEIKLYHDNGHPNLSNVVCYAIHKHDSINIANAYESDKFDFSGPKAFDKANNYFSKSLLSIPLINHESDVIGALQLINATDPQSGEIIAFDEMAEQFVNALASQAATILTRQHLIHELENSFESLIQLIATAIDNKSAYTGGHCRRVPHIAMLLAKAADASTLPAFADFNMTDADHRELRVAAWLHDCGKISTPEHVVDKATKLETIFDRIELVATRLEIRKRDIEIAALKQALPPAALNNVYNDSLRQQLGQVDEDLSFLREANKGCEFMRECFQKRVQEIANTTLTIAGKVQPLLTPDEVKNLTIPFGTLTNDERKVINNHIVTTIAMLEKLEFPKDLKRVPEFAGGHHERVDGNGYPKGLTQDQMSIQARILAIADIFEALTARDRPYKQGKSLDEALAILKRMSETGHLDPNLYQIFIDGKIHLAYAECFLQEDKQ